MANKKETRIEFVEDEVEVPTPKAQEPNLIFVGKREMFDAEEGKFVKVPAEAPKFFNTAWGRVHLPDSETQHKGFYHERANLIRNTFPDLYKEPTSKGGK